MKLLYICLKHLKPLIVLFLKGGQCYAIHLCAVRRKVPIQDTIIVAENRRSAYKQSEGKNGACFVASRANHVTFEHVTIYFV